MSEHTILIVEDDVTIARFVELELQHAGFDVLRAGDGTTAIELAAENPVDLVLLDLMLPGIDGLEVCRRLKAHPDTRDIPIVMLTAKDSEADIVAGLEIGATDYVCKPFSPRVLLARIHAVLRRPSVVAASENAGPVIEIGPLTVDPGRHKIEIKGKEIPLTLTEFRILHLLAENSGRAFSRRQIVDQVRGESYTVTERIVDVQMVSLRKKLGNLGDWVETVRGVGYRFKET